MLDWDLPSPFILNYRVDPVHIDSLNHVNNAVYVGWCQEAGWAHSQALGLGIEEYRQLDTAMAIRHADYDYINAAYLNDDLQLGTWLSYCDGRLQLERGLAGLCRGRRRGRNLAATQHTTKQPRRRRWRRLVDLDRNFRRTLIGSTT